MTNKNFKYLFLLFLLLTGTSCDDSLLDVKNPNNVTIGDMTQEGAFLSWANGAVYFNGFNGLGTNTATLDAKYVGSNYLGDSFWYAAMQYHELMADVIGVSSANLLANQIGVPDEVAFSDGTKVVNTAPVKSILRTNNSRQKAGLNPFYYEWTYMYMMNNACNGLLEHVDAVHFSGDAATRVATIKAWAYWWKGWAYSRIGSLYYAGLINDTFNQVNGNYVSHDEMIAEANRNFDKAVASLADATSDDDYQFVLGTIIPDFCQVGKGGVLSIDEWKRNVNTMKARNLLVNKRTKEMTAQDWNAVLTLANDGVRSTDIIFTGRTRDTNYFFSTLAGSVAATTVTTAQNFWPTERYMQEFDKVNDQRWLNNFETRAKVKVDNGGTIIYGARYYMVDGGNGLADVVSFGSRTTGEYELYLASTYEENELMKAEALINLGTDLAGGLQLVDNVRSYQGAALAPVSGVVTDPVEAKEILRRERRIALTFHGLSFYDYRRVGFLDPVSQGGGRKNAVVVRSATVVDDNATINYNFLDYWDVPDDEIALNPNTGSAVTKNPN
jgi:hypothetical protein